MTYRLNKAGRLDRKASSLDVLRRLLPEGSKVWARLVKHNGSSDLYAFYCVDPRDGEIVEITAFVSHVLDYPHSNRIDAVLIRGGGMDLGACAVNSLGHVLHANGYALTHRRMS